LNSSSFVDCFSFVASSCWWST